MKNYLWLLISLVLLCNACQNYEMAEQENASLYHKIIHHTDFKKLVDIRQQEMCILAETDKIMESELFEASELGGEVAVAKYVAQYEKALNEMDQAINDHLLTYLKSGQEEKRQQEALTNISSEINASSLTPEMKAIQIAYHQLLIEGNEGQLRSSLYQNYPELNEDNQLLTDIFLEYVQDQALPTCLDLNDIPVVVKK